MVALCACGSSSGSTPDSGGGGSDGNRMVSFSSDVQPIFTANCALSGCHDAATHQQGLILEQGMSYALLVNVASAECSQMRVVPGDSSNSYLADKITNTNICSGVMMPLTGSLSTSQVQTIVNWIDQGAMNN